MKESFYTFKLLLLSTLMLMWMAGCQTEEIIEEITSEEENVNQNPLGFQQNWDKIEGQYIVFLKEEKVAAKFPELMLEETSIQEERRNFNPEEKFHVVQKSTKQSAFKNFADKFVKKYSLKKAGASEPNVKEVYESTFGFLVEMSAREAEELEEDDMVDFVGEDAFIAMNFEPLIKSPFIPSNRDGKEEKAPYGIKSIGGSVNVEGDPSYLGLWVWIIDTGVDRNHPDLNVIHARDFTKDKNNVDGVGHGTHVAGIVGAKANGYGVTGVAAGANIVSVKVLDSKGKGKVSSVIKGLNYVKRNSIPGDIINISLGGDKESTVDFIIKKFQSKRVNIVMAAGNKGRNVSEVSPASNDGPYLYTVGATGWDGRYQWWSNYGSSVDFAAPGLGILSTFPGGKYAYMSGTSMAAPHVSGVLFLGFGQYSVNGTVYYKGRNIPRIRHRN